MLQKLNQFVALSFLSLLLIGCGEEKGKLKMAFTGAPGEVVCVVPPTLWNAGLDTLFEQHLYGYYKGLPQPEYLFNYLYFQPKDVNALIKNHRNYISVIVDTEIEEAQLRRVNEKFAKDQLYFEIVGKNYADIYAKSQEVLPYLTGEIIKKERTRLVRNNIGKNELLESKSQRLFGAFVSAPAGFIQAKEKSHFLWFKRERVRNLSGTNHDITDGILLFESPYTDSSSVNDTALIATLNKYLAEVPGPDEGSHMEIEQRFYLDQSVVNYSNLYAKETRGLWKMNSVFMGGPFLCLSVPDIKNGRIIHALGFVYAPKFNKREYIRELEAIVYSLQF